MTDVSVCITVHGDAGYFRAARHAALSVLEHSEFELVIARGEGPGLGLPDSARLRNLDLQAPTASGRAYRFLHSFEALRACLEEASGDLLISLDSDALLCRRLDAATIDRALQGRSMGMAEQTTIRGSGWTRQDLHRNFVEHALAWIDPGAPPPQPASFRFHNGGVVVARREVWEALTAWALEEVRAARGEPRVGEHMIGNQGFYQYWTNVLHPGSCTTLSWHWNHCEHWDEAFPSRDAFILHFANHCLGPGRRQPLRMAMARRAARGGPLAPLWWWLVREGRYR